LNWQAGIPRISASEADSEPFDPKNIAAAQDRTIRSIKARRGQQAFRDALLEAYKGRCAITGCPVVDVLEAAHVTPYLGPETNDITNGLLLRADLHTLLDCGLIGIDPVARTIILAPTLRAASDYKDLHGLRLRDPVPVSAAPSPKALAALMSSMTFA
jgi:predicted restriction endonuclease